MLIQARPNVLTVAGSDSGGGAGIQADIKTIEAHCLHGLSVITAVTAQNSITIEDIFILPPEIVLSQLNAIFNDFDIKVVKIGMLGNNKIIQAVFHFFKQKKTCIIIWDPVLKASVGNWLLDLDSVDTLTSTLLKITTFLTPNIPEAEWLLSTKIETFNHAVEAAKEIKNKYSLPNVILKGGHLPFPDTGTDILIDVNNNITTFKRSITPANVVFHGTGCVFSSALACQLALGEMSAVEAVRKAKLYIEESLSNAYFQTKGSKFLGHLKCESSNSFAY